ncbi:MAG: hypothetical protein BWY82_02444 [Verrucomicrobia bacterium ADurb.Bin474]|nr:MAG: hypothetical protein BWY82_02444 [Verrucomicrobia bacterium ADurb.Bin474]
MNQSHCCRQIVTLILNTRKVLGWFPPVNDQHYECAGCCYYGKHLEFPIPECAQSGEEPQKKTAYPSNPQHPLNRQQGSWNLRPFSKKYIENGEDQCNRSNPHLRVCTFGGMSISLRFSLQQSGLCVGCSIPGERTQA